MRLKRCAQCGGTDLRDVNEAVVRTFDAITVSARLPAQRCTKCKEVYFHGPVIERFDLEVARRLAELGAGTGRAFQFMRKTAGIRAVDLAALLGVTGETISRWERGKVPVDRAAFVLLGSIVLDRLSGRSTTVDRLRAVGDRPKKQHVRIRIKSAA